MPRQPDERIAEEIVGGSLSWEQLGKPTVCRIGSIIKRQCDFPEKADFLPISTVCIRVKSIRLPLPRSRSMR